MRLPHDIIVLVTDGTRMLLLKNHGDQVYPDLRVIGHRQIENPPNRELLSDAPGLGFSSGYAGRDTFSKSDPHQDNEDRFIAGVAEALAQAADAAKGLIVAAPPDALGELRRHYDARTRKALVAEIDRDFVNHPVDEITRLLSAHGEEPEM
jgi:protein required for attachment to host cells